MSPRPAQDAVCGEQRPVRSAAHTHLWSSHAALSPLMPLPITAMFFPISPLPDGAGGAAHGSYGQHLQALLAIYPIARAVPYDKQWYSRYELASSRR